MSRLTRAFEGQAFIGYLTAGQGGFDASVAAGLALVSGGVDILELGIPFSEATAEGPVIQQAMGEALAAGTTPHLVLEIAQAIRQACDAPIVLMGYYNPLLSAGQRFYEAAAAAGVDGMLVVDLPPEHAGLHERYSKEYGLERIYLVSPTTPYQRLSMIAKHCSGFLYYVCQKGTTGMREHLPADFGEKIKQVRKASCVPVAVGFGISTREAAAEVLDYADGFVVGSAFVDLMNEGKSQLALRNLAKRLDPRSSR